MAHILRTETALWDFIRPKLLGRNWRRLENTAGHGEADAFGFFSGETHWLELKIGKPNLRKLRGNQYNFVIECIRAQIPVWLCFAHRGKPCWYAGLDLDHMVRPPFYGDGFRRAMPGRRTPVAPDRPSS